MNKDKMDTEFVINLNDISALKGFINEIINIGSDVDAIFEKQILDAKSLIGVMSIAIHPITVVIHSDDSSEIERFAGICRKYEV